MFFYKPHKPNMPNKPHMPNITSPIKNYCLSSLISANRIFPKQSLIILMS